MHAGGMTRAWIPHTGLTCFGGTNPLYCDTRANVLNGTIPFFLRCAVIGWLT